MEVEAVVLVLLLALIKMDQSLIPHHQVVQEDHSQTSLLQ
tara:strand:+ start:248 stop:367 length:120 start_codon:yes stop_codon:yes gene_type:complete